MRIYSFFLMQGFNFSKSNFEPKQWEGPGNNRNDKGCQVVAKLNQAEKSKFISVLSKINESKLSFIFHRQMIPAREHLLFPSFYKFNHLHCQTIDVSFYNNANDWSMCLI